MSKNEFQQKLHNIAFEIELKKSTIQQLQHSIELHLQDLAALDQKEQEILAERYGINLEWQVNVSGEFAYKWSLKHNSTLPTYGIYKIGRLSPDNKCGLMIRLEGDDIWSFGVTLQEFKELSIVNI
jgi:hypothetical protein